MLYTKKGFFLRKLASKLTTRNSSKTKDGRPSDQSEFCKDQTKLENEVLQQPRQGNNAENNGLSIANSDSSFPVEKDKPIVSGLLAAKLQCDEWGLGKIPAKRRNEISAPTNSSIVIPSKSPIFLRNQKLNKKANTFVRSRSMKERRQAKASLRQFQSYSLSLSRIDEMDENENGID